MNEPSTHDLTTDECWEHLARTSFGRIATAALGEVSITPFNYVVDGRRLVFRTAEGTKLADIVIDSSVAVEADDVSGTQAWSVIARGSAHIVERSDEVTRLEGLGLRPWVESDKEVWVAIDVDEVTGRSFQLAR